MAGKKKTNKSKPIDSLKHKDKRANIPTEELRDFVKEDENRPETALYPRDPSLDPQLVWKGKDEQDQRDLAVASVPIYIQEKIHPQSIIEDVRRTEKKEAPAQASLFEDFNGIEFEEMIDFYHHGTNWSNRMILGDSLYVMTSLAEKEGLKGQVQMFYIDPPYGIKFGSNWQVSTRKRDVKDGKVEEVTRQPEQIKAFRDTWKLGIHSYLSYLRDHLVVSRELLTETGSVFVQIGDENVHLVRCLMDEVFGAENFAGQVFFRKTGGHSDSLLGAATDTLLWYAKDRVSMKFRPLTSKGSTPPIDEPNYVHLHLENGTMRRMTVQERRRLVELPLGARIFRYGPITGQGPSEKDKSISFEGKEYIPERERHWSTKYEGMEVLKKAGRILSTGRYLGFKLYWDEVPGKLGNIWNDTQSGGFLEDRIYVVQTTPKVIERCLLMSTDPGRPRPRSHLREWHYRLRCRAVGTAMDHHRYFPSRYGACPHTVAGR